MASGSLTPRPTDDALPALVLLNGPPCSGKSSLLPHIQRAIQLPAFTKDIVKESLYQNVGWSDRAWSRKLGRAAIDLLWEFAASLLRQRRSCLVEANFEAEPAAAALQRLRRAIPFTTVQIFMIAEPSVLERRFRDRARSASRHPGHLDHLLQFEYSADRIPASQRAPVPVPGPLLKMDTTHMDAALAADQLSRLRAWLLGLGLRP